MCGHPRHKGSPNAGRSSTRSSTAEAPVPRLRIRCNRVARGNRSRLARARNAGIASPSPSPPARGSVRVLDGVPARRPVARFMTSSAIRRKVVSLPPMIE